MGLAVAGEEAHQKLRRRGAMEPPLQVWGDKALHGGDVAAVQGLIKGEDHPLIAFLQFLRVSQFLKKGRGKKSSCSPKGLKGKRER